MKKKILFVLIWCIVAYFFYEFFKSIDFNRVVKEIRNANAVSSMEKPLSQSDLKDLSKKKDKVEEKVEEEVEMEEETFEL